MQELELNYQMTTGKVYSEEEDRHLLCRLNYYGMTADDVYERIKKDVEEFSTPLSLLLPSGHANHTVLD
jgi:SWI/SNF-related matrix-associated actin-dependent regulator of chromatin subfamily A member 5